jgi:(p)ppGpp synthase/HD superfamily hydrolase
MTLDTKIIEAFEFAFHAHQNKYRKGTEIPYICHPLDVASVLMKNNADSDLITAGLLHDVVEDAGVELSEIERKFGGAVTELVRGASEPPELRTADLDSKQTWRARKQHTIDFSTNASREMKMLSCADKLSNIRDMLRDHQLEGDKFWERFNASKDEQSWYYRSMVTTFESGEEISDLPMYEEFKECVERLFG